MRRCLRLAFRRAIPILAAPALVAGTLAAAPAPHHAGSPLPATGAHAGRRAVAGALSPGRAEKLAERTGRRVTVSALTTPTSLTTVSPRGRFTVTESAVPVRAWRGGRWRPLNATLHRQRNGTISPAVTTNGLALSGGGTGTLAVMNTEGRSLSLSWPGPALPAPTLSGPTATYANVLPGVDLLVTADDQGGFSDVLVIHSAAAAANPALASLQLTAATQGLVLSVTAAGNVSAAAGPTAPPLITAQAPRMWDSTLPPSGMPTVTSPDGTVLNANNGLPAYSSATAPGSGAHVATVPVALSGTTITLTPPASVLTGPGITYPVYIDPTWHNFASTQATKWTQVDSGFPTTSYWMENSDLQAGDCYDDPQGSCNGLGVARSFIRWPIPNQLTSTTDVHQAFLYMTETWAPSCTQKSVRLYTTSPIDSSTTWNHQPTWASSYTYQDAAFGHDSSCPYYKNDITWDVTSTIADDAASSQGYQTWGLRAANESDTLGWKKFKSGSSNLTLSVTYNYPPNKPDRTTSPGGDCYYSATGAPVIGNDAVTFSASASDDDGDNNLTTEFIILNSAGKPVYDTALTSPVSNVVTGDNAIANLTLNQATMQGLGQNGGTTEYTYHWYAMVTDEFGLTSKQPTDNCYFTYNPNGPTAPQIFLPNGDTGTLGTQLTAQFTTRSCGSPSPCPLSYTYQDGAAPPVTVPAGTDANATATVQVPIGQFGPAQLTVYGTASGGNPSEASNTQIQGTKPSPAYPDGYFTGGSYPDLLTTGTGTTASLWLSTGTGNGTTSAPADIGSLGVGLSPGSEGPGDWSGALVLHGDFTGRGVQDVMAYYPGGGGEVIAGNGNATSLVPSTANASTVSASAMQSPSQPTGDDPIQLVAAGNVSGIGTGTDDLIGISGDTTNGYELDLYTNGTGPGGAFSGGYQFNQTLTTTAPNSSNWKSYALATAQPGCYPHSTDCNPAGTILFALNKTTGVLWETTNPGGPAQNPPVPISWTKITVPWGTTPPTLASADINHAGQTELWALSGTTATAYTLSGTTLAQEATSPLAAPSDDWPLTDGDQWAHTSTATTAVDTTGGNTANLNGGATWAGDNYFSTTIGLDGTGYLTPPAATVPVTDPNPSISVWFKTTTPGGVIASLQGTALTPSGTSTTYDPILYVGTDGYLYAQWYTGKVAPLTSNTTTHPVTVDDGLWHHAILTTTGSGTTTTQTLTVDGYNQGTLTAALKLQGDTNGNTNLTFGAGYIGGNWPSEPHQGQTSTPYYLQGQTADITFTQ